jgi:hypothetical protein
VNKHRVFEYLYRDAGNYKVWGELLLEGEINDEKTARLTLRLEEGELFIAEQIGIPTLYEELWRECQCEPSDELDHAWHEFSEIREATHEDLERLKPWGSLSALLERFEKVDSWDLALSSNGEF